MNISEDKIKSRFVLEVNPSLQLNRESFSKSNYYRYKTKVNSVQEWYLINTDTLDSHPIHIHVNHFQVISYKKYTGGYGVMSKDKHLVMFNQSSEKCYYQNQHYTGHEQYKLPVEPLKYLGHDIRWKEGGPNAVG
uniref:Plastocyanin-like domain-containing protein n=1 Tax=Ciona savignyi TaxID=51511 RepID=H2YJ31_CIOSA